MRRAVVVALVVLVLGSGGRRAVPAPDPAALRFAGCLMGPDGAPVAGAHVELVEGHWRPEEGRWFDAEREGSAHREVEQVLDPAPRGGVAAASTQTDDEGRFRFEGRSTQIAAHVRLPADSAWAVAVRSTALRDASRYTYLQVVSAVHAKGRVLDAEGAPVAGFVSLRSVPPVGRVVGPHDVAHARVPRAREVPIGADGRFRTCGVVPGCYEVAVRVPGRGVYLGRFVHLPRSEPVVVRVERTAGASVQGTVLDVRGEPVAGAHVLVVMRPDSQRLLPWQLRLVETDADGRYRVDGLPGGLVASVSVVKDGHVPAEGWHAARPLVGRVESLDVTLGLGATVTGVVRDETSDPLAGVQVETTNGAKTRSDADGRYRFQGLSLAPIGVFARSLMHTTTVDASVLHDRFRLGPVPGSLRLTQPGEVVEHDLVLVPTGCIAGCVLDGGGNGIEGALVRASPRGFSSGELPVLWGTTDASGRFCLRGTVRGSTWRVSAAGLGTIGEETVEVKVDDLAAVPAVELRVRPPASVAGRAVDEEERPVVGAEVRLAPRGDWGVKRITSSEGRFRFEGVRAGDWTVSTGGGAKSADVAVRERVAVAWGEVLDGVTLVREGVARVGGRVVGPDGEPHAGVVVSLESTVPAGFQDRWHFRSGLDFWNEMVVTDELGRFRVVDLRARDWWIRPNRREGDGPRGCIAADEMDAELVFREPVAGASMVVEVVAKDGTPIGRLGYWRSYVSPGMSSSYGSGCGGNRAVVGLGAYEGAEATFVVNAAWDVHGRDMGIQQSAPVPIAAVDGVVRVTVESGLAIRGVVLDEEDRPVPHASIERSRGSRGDRRVTYADEEGRFSITGLAPDQAMKLRASPPAPYVADDVAEAKAGTEDVVLRVRRGHLLAGRVLASDGFPVAGAEVEAEGKGWSRKKTTDASGRFRFGTLEEKRVHLRVRDGEADPWPYLGFEEDVEADGDDIEVRLEPAAYVNGRVAWPSEEDEGHVEVELVPLSDDRGEKVQSDHLWRGGIHEDDPWRFSFGPLPPGKRYRLTAAAWGEDAHALQAEMEVTPSATDLVLELRPPLRVRIQLLGDDVGGFCGVLLKEEAGRTLVQPLAANDRGTFLAKASFEGPYRVHLGRAGDDRHALLDGYELARVAREVRLVAGLSIEGRLTGIAAPLAPERAHLAALRADGVHAFGAVEADGRFRVTGLPTGTYVLDALVVGDDAMYRGRVEGTRAGAREVVVPLGAGD